MIAPQAYRLHTGVLGRGGDVDKPLIVAIVDDLGEGVEQAFLTSEKVASLDVEMTTLPCCLALTSLMITFSCRTSSWSNALVRLWNR